MSSFLLDAIPIWAIFVALLLILFGSVLVGFRLGQRRRRRPDELADKQLDLSGVALAAMLTLIGLLLAFTFSLASGRKQWQIGSKRSFDHSCFRRRRFELDQLFPPITD